MGRRCNINWIEIKSQLQPGQSPYDRPDLIARVFKKKLDEIVKDLETGEIFGRKCVAIVVVIEFQKRGAPHAHILVWYENFDSTPYNIDKCISAEFPSPDSPIYNLVLEKMVHGPCGDINPTLSCMQNGTC